MTRNEPCTLEEFRDEIESVIRGLPKGEFRFEEEEADTRIERRIDEITSFLGVLAINFWRIDSRGTKTSMGQYDLIRKTGTVFETATLANAESSKP